MSPLASDLSALRRFFNTGTTKTFSFRKQQLIKLKQAVLQYEPDLYEALYADLKKSPEETWVTETGMVIAEINTALKNLHHWMKPEKKATNLANLPSSSYTIKEPYGVSLIIGPWNYPFMLLMTPLIGAMGAGNCAVIKPSEFAPATSEVIKKMIDAHFPRDYILFVEGEGAAVVPQMMDQFTFDHVFYTGSTTVGRHIYKMAADKLVPVTLELGGKCPCVIESDANCKVAARRIALTKFSNAGQMCVAPDYLLVHASVKEEFINALKDAIRKFFGDRPEDNYNYGRIINESQFDRIVRYLSDGTVIAGGRYEREKLFIEPTLLDDVKPDVPVMKEEIFGPVLPVLSFRTPEEARAIIAQNPDPLAFYIFTSSEQKEKDWLGNVASGGACVNNTSWHLTNHHLPFGGRGTSGMGNYHGQYSFEAFSHTRAVMKTPAWFDPAIRYPPFKGKLKFFKWIVR